MNQNAKNLLLIFLPVAAVTAADAFLKKIAITATPNSHWWIFKIDFSVNRGIISGLFSSEVTPVFQIPMVTLGVFLLVCLYFLQLFAPIRSPAMRIFISVFFGGIFANVVDRLSRGFVVDYLSLELFGWRTPSFNFADVVQYIGIVLMFVWQFKSTTFDERYNKKLWVSKEFQKRYSWQLTKTGFFLMLVFGVLCFTFIRVALNQMPGTEAVKTQLIQDFSIFYISTAVTFLIFLYLIGRSLSAYVAKPMLNFEHYLRSLAAGEYNLFQVGEPEFHYLEKLSDEVRDHMTDLRHKLDQLEARQMNKKSKGGGG